MDLTFGIGYDDDAEKAMALILETAKADGRIHADPEPWVRVTALNTSSVDITARLWCATADYWDLKFTLTKAVKDAFDKTPRNAPCPCGSGKKFKQCHGATNA